MFSSSKDQQLQRALYFGAGFVVAGAVYYFLYKNNQVENKEKENKNANAKAWENIRKFKSDVQNTSKEEEIVYDDQIHTL